MKKKRQHYTRMEMVIMKMDQELREFNENYDLYPLTGHNPHIDNDGVLRFGQ